MKIHRYFLYLCQSVSNLQEGAQLGHSRCRHMVSLLNTSVQFSECGLFLADQILAQASVVPTLRFPNYSPILVYLISSVTWFLGLQGLLI